MSYADLIRKSVSSAIAAVGDLATTVDYYSVDDDPVYNVSTDTMTIVSTLISVRAVLVRYSRWEIQNQVARSTDQKALISALDLGVTPRDNDYVMINSRRWNVIRIQTVPGDGLYMLQLRES